MLRNRVWAMDQHDNGSDIVHAVAGNTAFGDQRHTAVLKYYLSFFSAIFSLTADGCASASSLNATTTYPIKMMLAATIAAMADVVVEPVSSASPVSSSSRKGRPQPAIKHESLTFCEVF